MYRVIPTNCYVYLDVVNITVISRHIWNSDRYDRRTKSPELANTQPARFTKIFLNLNLKSKFKQVSINLFSKFLLNNMCVYTNEWGKNTIENVRSKCV